MQITLPAAMVVMAMNLRAVQKNLKLKNIIWSMTKENVKVNALHSG